METCPKHTSCIGLLRQVTPDTFRFLLPHPTQDDSAGSDRFLHLPSISLPKPAIPPPQVQYSIILSSYLVRASECSTHSEEYFRFLRLSSEPLLFFPFQHRLSQVYFAYAGFASIDNSILIVSFCAFQFERRKFAPSLSGLFFILFFSTLEQWSTNLHWFSNMLFFEQER